MPRRTKKSKYLTKRGLPYALMKTVETKYQSQNEGGFLITVPPTFSNNSWQLYDINPGLLFNNRVGNEIQTRSFFCRIFAKSVDGATQVWCRALLYSPRDASATSVPINSLRDIPDHEKYIIWSDKSINCAGQPGGGSGILVMKKRWRPYMKTLYSSSDNNSVQKGAVMLIVVSNVDQNCQIDIDMRLYYKDV